MKITTRIICGYGLFIAILAGMAIYQVITVHYMDSVNRVLRGIHIENAVTSLQAIRDRDLVEEYTRKSLALADPDYLNQLKEYQKDYETRVIELRNKAASVKEREDVSRLQKTWTSFAADLRQLQRNLPPGGTELPVGLQDDLDKLRIQTASIYQNTLRSMAAEVENSRNASELAVRISWCAVFMALAISILVSLLIYRSISHPLAHLTEGTRAIAEGKFYYRLDTSRNDEFSQLAKDFNSMIRRLNELDKMKKDFVSHVSHELKVPLVSMRETIQLMLEQIPGPLTEKQKRLLDLNLQSGYRLTAMISNLLDLSKMEAGVMEYELKKQDLVPIVQNAIAEIEVLAAEKQIQIQAELPEDSLMLECDAGRIMQVIVNLIGNAVKFSPKKEIVYVRVGSVREIPSGMQTFQRNRIPKSRLERSYALVSVSDFGPGIADLEKERIFDRFHQVKSDIKLAGQGVGLGLAISRTIIEAHHGAIWVEDNPGGGSRFLLLLLQGDIRRNESSQASVAS